MSIVPDYGYGTHTNTDKYSGTCRSKAKAKAGAGAMEKSLQKVIIYFMLFCAVPTRRKRRTVRERGVRGLGQVRTSAGRKLQLGCVPARPLFIYLWAFYTASSAEQTKRRTQLGSATGGCIEYYANLFFFFGNFSHAATLLGSVH